MPASLTTRICWKSVNCDSGADYKLLILYVFRHSNVHISTWIATVRLCNGV